MKCVCTLKAFFKYVLWTFKWSSVNFRMKQHLCREKLFHFSCLNARVGSLWTNNFSLTTVSFDVCDFLFIQRLRFQQSFLLMSPFVWTFENKKLFWIFIARSIKVFPGALGRCYAQMTSTDSEEAFHNALSCWLSILRTRRRVYVIDVIPVWIAGLIRALFAAYKSYLTLKRKWTQVQFWWRLVPFCSSWPHSARRVKDLL